MNILMVNPVHPATPHVSGVRAWRFAAELAGLGHRVVLLTGSRQQATPFDALGLAEHDWRTPFVLSCRLSETVARTLPRPLSRVVTCWKVLRYGGQQTRWVANAVKGASAIADRFIPDVVWCTFGTLEGVLAARRIASRGGYPWVLDIKDNWEIYVPAGLRTLMAWRTRGWVALTANAELTAAKALKWQGSAATVVYSGVDDSFFADRPTEDVGETFAVNLVGSIYHRVQLDNFLTGLNAWIRTLSAEQMSAVTVRYLGGDSAIVQEALGKAGGVVGLRVCGYVPVPELARLCRTASLNAYVAHPQGFHHKLLELLSCGPPVLACPRESAESRLLARELNRTLIEASDSTRVSSEIARVHRAWLQRSRSEGLLVNHRSYTWPQQTKRLESRLREVVSTS